MGIHGIYKEIGPGDRIALSKLAVEKFEQTGRPLRIAIDTSIWLFQIQSGKGGTNPALRTFYYRLLRLLSLSIHPLFVFDGPNKPPFKRNKRTGPNVASIPEFLAKQLLKQFGFPFHIAPGEAEAECALLQKEGIVDVVLSEDVDTLMFGSRMTLRNWSPEQKSSKVPTHVNLYDADKTKAGPSGLDREGMILVALMSGGDYLPEGIPGCGPKTACEAARAGFGRSLCAIKKGDTSAFQKWREDLAHELRSNESKFFKRKHGALSIPGDFPRADILSYYTRPAVSSRDGLERLKRNLRWDQNLNFSELRTFTADAFEWVKVSGAKKFIRNLAPALLVRHLRMRGQAAAEGSLPEDPAAIETQEPKLVASIHGKRQHASTDNTPELRVAFSPIGIVNIDLDAEEPDDEPDVGEDEEEEEQEEMALAADGDGDGEATKKRGPYLYDPTQIEKIWVFETFVKVGAPLTVQDWEERQRRKPAPKPAPKPAKVTKPRATRTITSGMQKGALDRFTRITKAGVGPPSAKRRSPSIDRLDLSRASDETQRSPDDPSSTAPCNKTRDKPSRALVSPPRVTKAPLIIDILSSPDPPRKELHSQAEQSDEHYFPPNITKRIRTLRRSQTSPGGCADPEPSQTQATPGAFQTSPMAGDLFTATALHSISETESEQQALPKSQRTARPQPGSSRVAGPSTPSRRRQQQKDCEEVSPSKRQMTLEESFGFSRDTRRSRSRDESFLAMKRNGASEAEVEELDLSRSSPPASQRMSLEPQSHPKVQKSSHLDRLDQAASKHEFRGRKATSGEGVFQAISGNRDKKPEIRKAKGGVDKAPSRTAHRLARLEVSPELRRSPRRHDGSRFNAAEGGLGLRRSPRQHRTASPEPNKAVRLRALTRVDQGAREEGGKKKQKKRVIKLRESLQGSWKLVEASSVEALDITGDGRNGNASDSKDRGSRRAWRQSEVEVLDLTSD